MKKVLILEDNPRILSILLDKIAQIEEESGFKIAVFVVSQGEKVSLFQENLEKDEFDAILLDRYSRDEMDFHRAVMGKINPKKTISISSMPQANQEAKEVGVDYIVEKNYLEIKIFGEKVKEKMKKILNI